MSKSLADLAYVQPIDVWVVFTNIDENIVVGRPSPFWRLLRKNFRHVEVWKFYPPYAWVRHDTGIELIATEVHTQPPWEVLADRSPTCMRVQHDVKLGKIRSLWFMGPVTCVELTKAFIGISAFWVRTPSQLYNFLKRQKQCQVEHRNRRRKILLFGSRVIGRWKNWLSLTKKRTVGSKV